MARAIPDDILENIFSRVDNLPDLARSCVASPTFKRIISSPRFLQRYWSLHSPPVLGLLDLNGFCPANPPHLSAPAARAFAEAADFSFEFLPEMFRKRYHVSDVRDGRVLLICPGAEFCKNFVVCDPLYHRCVELPPIPPELVPKDALDLWDDFDHFLYPASKEDKEKMKNESFRVISAALWKNNVLLLRFSSSSGEWDSITIEGSTPDASTRPWFRLSADFLKRHCVHGCIYWTTNGVSSMFKVDMNNMRYSDVPFLDCKLLGMENAVVEAEAGKVCFLSLAQSPHHDLDVYYLNFGAINGPEEWRYDSTVSLPQRGRWRFLATEKSYAVLQCSQSYGEEECWIVDAKKASLERLCHGGASASAFLYRSFPPPFALPNI